MRGTGTSVCQAPLHTGLVALRSKSQSQGREAKCTRKRFRMGSMIEVEKINVFFGTARKSPLHAVCDVTVSVSEGESFGLVGESGSGKSTVLLAIANLGLSWSGRILINGEAMSKNRSLKACRQMQLVFQDPYGSL